MSIVASDPLALIAIEAGLVKAPLQGGAAQGENKLDSPQRAAVLGDAVPIVFGKRDEEDETGGVLISPPATEARFTNSNPYHVNAVTAYYHLVLSEGQIGLIQVRDVFQRSCRVGSFTQTYNRRAGDWEPGNEIVNHYGSYTMPECPYYCGNVGVYTNMSTLSFQNELPNGSDQWNRQVHCFIRNGMQVPRLIEGTTGSSNNFADLVLWALRNCAMLPDSMIDLTALTLAASFLAENKLSCDIAITQSENLADFLAKTAPYFLLAETRNNGKRGLRPLLPLNEDYTINTGEIVPVFTFTEEHIQPDGLEISYSSLVDRRPFCAQTIWRQQLTDDFGIIRTSEVRYSGEAADGPYEQHDLSAFCTREDHAVKVAAYIRARRKHITHTIRLNCLPISTDPELLPGDIVRVSLQRKISGQEQTSHDYLYEINRISRAVTGQVTYEMTHFPVDADGASLVSLDVTSATPTGIILESNKTGVGCDVNSSTDTSVPSETWTAGSPIDNQVEVTPGTEARPAPTEDRYASLYVYSVGFDGQTLVIKVRISPTGRAPVEALGDLTATVTSSGTYAVNLNGDLVSPQPEGLPSLSFTGLVAKPWTASNYPAAATHVTPPKDWVFQGEFRIHYPLSAFTHLGQRYEMPFNITATNGGFDSVTILNAGTVVFPDHVPATKPLGHVRIRQYCGNTYFEKNQLAAHDFLPIARLTSPYTSEARGYGWGDAFGYPSPAVEPVPPELTWQSQNKDGNTYTGQQFTLDLMALQTNHPSATTAEVELFASWYTSNNGYTQQVNITTVVEVFDHEGTTPIKTASFTRNTEAWWYTRPDTALPLSELLNGDHEVSHGPGTAAVSITDLIENWGTIQIDLTTFDITISN